jgi:hypothetical protein
MYVLLSALPVRAQVSRLPPRPKAGDQVAVFDPEPIGFSRFMSCVTHSLVLTDQGLFEVGPFQATSLINQNRYWQWFLHRRLATPEQVPAWKERHDVALTQAAERFLAVYFSCAKRRSGLHTRRESEYRDHHLRYEKADSGSSY